MDEGLQNSESGNEPISDNPDSSDGSNSSDGEVDDLHDNSETIHIVFETIKKEFNEGKIDLSNLEGLKAFMDTYKDYLGKLTSETHYKHTLLHVLVEGAVDKAFERYKPLVELIIQEYPGILKELDASGKTSLYNAIGLKCNELVDYICDTYTDINSVLEQPCTDFKGLKESCIHAAIHKGLNTESTIKLIKKANQKVLSIQDSRGNTALHSAVEYERCTKEQLKIVQMLAERGGSEAMKKRTYVACLSPYLYHMHTRPKTIDATKDTAEELAKEKTKNTTRGKRSNSSFAKLDGAEPTHWVDSKGPQLSVISGGQKMQVSGEPSPKSSLLRGSSAMPRMLPMNHKNLSLDHSKPESIESAVRSPLKSKECPDGSIDMDPKTINREAMDLETTTALKEKKKQNGKKEELGDRKQKRRKTEKGKDIKKSADAVQMFLMLHCMRTLNKKEAEDFLYGKTQGMSIFNTVVPKGFCMIITNGNICYA